MPAKRVLIVDDSQAARVVLSRMLEQHGIEFDMAESAEAAIDYLQRQRPDAIFMDHQMPGMDGLQAVKIIKNDPRTAMIPIMMYTSQEGELYVGQARALGAVGVLPKQVNPIDLKKVLFELSLLPDRRDPRRSVLRTVPDLVAPAAGATQEPRSAEALVPPPIDPAAPPVDPRVLEREVRAAVEPLLKAQSTEMRRLLMASVDGFAPRPSAEAPIVAPRVEPLLPPPPAPAPRPVLWIALVAVAAGALGLALVQLVREERDLEDLRTRLSSAERAAAVAEAHATERAAANDATRDALRALLAGFPAPAPGLASADPAAAQRALRAVAATAPDAPRVVAVAYGDTPLAGARLEALRTFATDLEQRGVSGVLHVTSYAGDFCLAGTPTEGYSLAPDDLPAKNCDLTGNPFDDALTDAQRESRAYAEFVAALPARSRGLLSVVSHAAGHANAMAAYPAAADATAAQWNAAAASNQRVEISFAPRNPAP